MKKRFSYPLCIIVVGLSLVCAYSAFAVGDQAYDASPTVEKEDGSLRFSRKTLAERTYDTLTAEEERELQRLSDYYFEQVKDESLSLVQVRFDVNTILRSFPEQIRIIRQRKRLQLLQVERYLYSLRLNPEFIGAYIDRLEKDSVYYALDMLIKKTNNFDRKPR